MTGLRKNFTVLATCLFIWLLISCSPDKGQQEQLTVHGLQQTVEVVRDVNGVNHIYALNEHDLFFAQGYCAARDRLFQFELWRRQATGTVAEILGERELKRDIGARLFQYRGDWKKEFSHYHPRGDEIIRAFTEGINAFIDATEKNPELLSPEFTLLGITPGRWTPEVVISRHQGLLGNLTNEVNIARAVAAIGSKHLQSLNLFEPGTPDLTLDPLIDQSCLSEDIIGLYTAFRSSLTFSPGDLIAHYGADAATATLLAEQAIQKNEESLSYAQRSIGSNNWIVSANKSSSDYPLLANDPHRALAAPSLRYMVHLHAPGWNVVGGGEPTIPGVSIGHNEYGAWGLTIFNIDGEDLMVYEINPANPDQYRYKNTWENFTIIRDTIRVKDKNDVYIEHRYTRHGPVTFIDTKRNRAYAVRCAWLEPGGAPYLASLRMDQATTWKEFRDACAYNHQPAENMIWADRNGTIGWQASGIAPVRKNWSGLVPVPGDGRYEWDGFLPIHSLPHVVDPEKGFWATANENLIPQNYLHRDAVGWEWADSSRANRINEVLAKSNQLNLKDMMALQVDYVSLPARQLVPYVKNIPSANQLIKQSIDSLLNWNFELTMNSVAAGIYIAWERQLSRQAYLRLIPEAAQPYLTTLPLRIMLRAVQTDHPSLGGRDLFLTRCFEDAVDDLQKKFGDDLTSWKYGQPDYHHVLIRHPMSKVLNDSIRQLFECGPMPRGGSGSTPGMTGNGDNQLTGASFRMVVDVADWDQSMFTNAPGQSGDVRSPYYRNLFESWAKDQYFAVYFSRNKIESHAAGHLILQPH